jgi:hypothetical protein
MKPIQCRSQKQGAAAELSVARFLLLTLLFVLAFLTKARTQDGFATFNLGPWIGNTTYSVKETGQKGSYSIRYTGLDMMAFGDNIYMRINLNMIFGTLAGSNFSLESTDDLFTMGSDVSFFDMAYGMNEGPLKIAFHFDYGMHGPRIPHVTEMKIYPEPNVSHYLSIGLEAAYLLTIGKIGRITSIATFDPVLFSSSGKKVLDGYVLGVESQIQFSALRYIGVGITPRLEYRNYYQKMFRNDELDTNTFKVRTFTTSAQIHVFVGF